jgi:hypothetical protein
MCSRDEFVRLSAQDDDCGEWRCKNQGLLGFVLSAS